MFTMYFLFIVTSCDFSSNGLYIACTVDISNMALIYDSRTYSLLQSIEVRGRQKLPDHLNLTVFFP